MRDKINALLEQLEKEAEARQRFREIYRGLNMAEFRKQDAMRSLIIRIIRDLNKCL
jgi:hypothetical protein